MKYVIMMTALLACGEKEEEATEEVVEVKFHQFFYHY